MNDADIIDYTTHCVGQATTDGPTRLVPSRQPAATPERADNRSELQILRSTVEGLNEEVIRLKSAVQFLLNERHPNGIPFDGSRTT